MPTEILEYNEQKQNDNVTESVIEIKSNENVCVLNNHWRELVKVHEKRLTEKDQVINALEKQLEAHQVIEDKDVKTDITFMDAAKFVAELTPVIGDAMAAKEVYDELQKDDPNYLLAGALGGATIIGLIPGIGDAAAAAIRAIEQISNY